MNNTSFDFHYFISSISLGIFKECPILFLGEEELSEDIVNNINKNFNEKVQIIM
jgi:hypothetical protein